MTKLNDILSLGVARSEVHVDEQLIENVWEDFVDDAIIIRDEYIQSIN